MELLGEFPADLMKRYHEHRSPAYRLDKLKEARSQFQARFA